MQTHTLTYYVLTSLQLIYCIHCQRCQHEASLKALTDMQYATQETVVEIWCAITHRAF